LSSFYNKNGEHHGQTNVQNKSYLLQEDCRLFDAAFFRINPKEAESIDPQQRILLETVYESLESAGWPLHVVEGTSTAVFVGCMTSDYNDILNRDPESLPKYTATGIARSILSNRISYVFDLKGPSVTLDTACSSSLVALQQAVQSLRCGDASQAIIAGTTLLLDPSMYIAESKLHMLSPDARSRMWDKYANGYARGEGCAAVILKPLSKAIADQDHIECIIREVGVGSDGRTDGITMPSATAQAALIRQTYEKAGLDVVADRCQYFECHGTGTLAGDPIEARAIHDAFFAGRSAEQCTEPLYCGSVKTVIGHLEGCAGLAGVLKASLALQNKTIPPNMHFNEINPQVAPFYDNLRVPVAAVDWPETQGKPLRASVNSFGFGGTNAHAILERYEGAPCSTTAPAEGLPCAGPFVISAKTRSALLATLKNSLHYVRQHPVLDLDSLSWMLRARRSVFAHRVAVAARDRAHLVQELEKLVATGDASADAALGVRASRGDVEGGGRRLLGVFTGQVSPVTVTVTVTVASCSC
jgi:acyl transferase domain-containing protein